MSFALRLAAMLAVAFAPVLAWAEASPAQFSLPSAQIVEQKGAVSSLSSGGVSIVSESGEIAFVFRTVSPSPFSVIEFVGASGLNDGAALFVWKPKGGELSEKTQMVVPVKRGKVRLPAGIDPAGFDFFGLVIPSQRLEFSDIRWAELAFADKWGDLFDPELVMPSTVNLLYGHKFWSTPIVKVLGVALLLFAASMLAFRKPKAAFGVVAAAWIAFDLLLVRDQALVMTETSRTFLAPKEVEAKSYYDFGNFYGFIERSRECLSGKAGAVNLYAPREWPFSINYRYHLLPVRATWQGSDAPYYAAFAGAEIRDGKRFFYQGKEIDPNVSVVCRFGNDSFILQKNR